MAGVIRMKTMMVTIIDVGPSMRNSPTENKKSVAETSKLDIAKSYIATFVLSRMMAVKTAEFCIVVSGDNQTHNYLNINQGGGYDRINERFPMTRASANLIELIHGITNGDSPGDTIDGIVVGFDILDRTNVGKAYNKVMLLVTDGENEIEGLDDLESIQSNMKSKDCAFYVLYMGKINGDSSSTKIRNAGVLQSLARSTGGRFCEANDLGDCLSLLSSAPGMCSKPREQKFVFEISPYMRVPCIVWNKTKPTSLPSIKKCPIGSAGESESNELATVKTEVTYRNPADEDEEVPMGDRIKGFKYGAQYIPIQEDEQNAFRILGPQGITLIGFVASSSVPRHHFLTKAVVFEGNPEIDCAVSTVRSLYSAMQTTDTVALIRYVSRENSEPYLGVLLPNTNGGDNESSFILHRLPVADDIREYAFPSFNTDTLDAQQKAAASSFVDSMTVKAPLPAQIRPFNPTSLELLLEFQKRYLNGRSMDYEVPSFKEPLCPGQPASIQNLRSQFPLKLSVENTLKRKVFWSDIQMSSGESATSTSTSSTAATGKGKGNEKQQNDTQTSESQTNDMETSSQTASNRVVSPSIGSLLAAASIAVQQFTEGSLNPVEEFTAVMATIAALPKDSPSPALGEGNGDKNKTARQEISEQVMTAMTGVIEKMVTAGGSAAYHRKGIACLEVFRAAAIDENVYKVFNTFMTDVVKEFYRTMPRYRPFWDMVLVKKITLISVAEVANSNISVDTAEKFLLEEEVAVEEEVVVKAGDDEDDMFAEMQ